MLKRILGRNPELENAPVNRVPYQQLSCYGRILDITRGSPLRVVMMSDILSEQNSFSSFNSRSSFVENITQGTTTGVVRPADLPNGNILIIAGNLTRTGDIVDLEKFNAFLAELCSLSKYDHVVFIAGEHDRTLDPSWIPSRGEKPDCNNCKSILLKNLPPSVHYLQDSSVTLYGLHIYGTPWVSGDRNESSRWAFQLTEAALHRKWRSIPRNTDILITRMPPYEIGDARHAAGRDIIVDGEQVVAWERKGSKSLRQRVKKVNPLLHVFGRECSGYGGYVWSSLRKRNTPTSLRTCFANVSICDEDFMPCHAPLVIDIDLPHARGYMELIGNEGATDYDKRTLDLYVSALIALKGIHLEGDEKNVLSDCLHLATTSTDANALSRQEMLVLHILDKYATINSLYECRRLCRGANEDSSADFASAQLVVPGMFIGGHHVAESKEMLRALGITHICCCYHLEPVFPMEFKYHVIDIEDEVGADITAHFYSCTKFIEAAIRGGGAAYVHCQLGMSRSATICMAYLMQIKNATYIQAHALVKRARPFICPNDSFVQQLQDLEDVGSIGC